jgi:predicted small secreted protein
MKRSSFLITLLVLTALALSACGGARGLMFKDISNGQGSSTEPIDSTQATEVQTTGTPDVIGQGGGEATDAETTEAVDTEAPSTEVVETEAPDTEQPDANKTPGGNSESDNSHEVQGRVTSITLGTNGTIVIDGVTYHLSSNTVIHGTITAGDTVRLTFGDSNGTLTVLEVKVTNANGSGGGQGDNNSQGGNQENGTPEPTESGGG